MPFLRFSLLVLLLQFPVSAQDPPNSLSFSELIVRMAVEREALVQFSVDCKVSGYRNPLLSEPKSDPKGDSEFRFEFSRIEKHSVFVYRETTADAKEKDSWRIQGVSRNCHFASDGKRLVVRAWSPNNPASIKSGSLPRLLDPRATGLGSCGDMQLASPFEKVASNLLNMSLKSSSAKLSEEGEYRFVDESRGLKLTVDPERDYWPVDFEYQPPGYSSGSTWKVELEKVMGRYVPASAKLTCSKSGSEDVEISFLYHWESVNESFSTGFESASRIAKMYGLEVKDLRP